MGNETQVEVLKTRLHIATGMSVQTVLQKGNICQKAVAGVFDVNNDGIYQENEAATFNSVRIRQNSKNSYTIWQKNDGKDTATQLNGDFSNLKFAPNRTENLKTVKFSAVKDKTAAPIDLEELVEQGKGTLNVDIYPSGAIKTKDYKSNDYKTRIHQEYYETGKPKSEKIQKAPYGTYHDIKRAEYYPNGQMKTSFTHDDIKRTREYKEYYENGQLKSEILKQWDDNAHLKKNYKGEYMLYGDYVEKTNIQYDKKGNVIASKKVVK